MNASQAIILTRDIQRYYETTKFYRGGLGHKINKALVRNLTKKEYDDFCDKSKSSMERFGMFKKEFFDNPDNTDKAVSDGNVAEHWNLSRLLDILSEVVS